MWFLTFMGDLSLEVYVDLFFENQENTFIESLTQL